LKLTRIGVEESAAKLIPAKSILFVVRGMILAHTFPVSVNLVETTVNQDMKALMPYLRGLEVFLRLLLESSSQRILSVVTKSTHGTRKLETEVYENFVIPLPPLAEQAAIVERVEALMTTCRLLEAEIAAARTHAAHLLQAVLKEAFAPAAKVAA
jgi:type I restriction enzyme S subunit